MNPQTQQLIGRAIEYFQNGSPAQAEEILVRILNTQSNNLPALEILGLIKASQGHHLESAKLLKKAVKLNPQNPATQYNLAKALSESKDYVGSLIHHEKALQLTPNNPDGWLNYGQTLAKLKRYEQALTAFNKALAINPNYAEAWYNKALGRAETQNYDEAVSCYQKVIELQPTHEKAWIDLSTSLGALKRYEEAIQCCDQALILQPQYPEAWLNKGSAYSELKQFEKALDCYDQALAIKNDYADTWYSKGIALEKLNWHEEALTCYDKAIELEPKHAKAWVSKGAALNYLLNYQLALDCFNEALLINPSYADALANKAVSLYQLCRFTEAIENSNKAIAIDPTYIDGYWNKSFSELILGQFDEGWKNYEYRWLRKDADQRLHANIPALPSLTDLQGKKILVWSEQGFGDTLQFARYIPKLAALGAIVTFEVQAPLAALFKDQYSCSLISKGDPIGELDFQIPLLSLPLLFKTNLESIPADIPYIQIARTKVQEWGGKLALSQEKLNIGIACSGNIHFDLKNGNKRPIPLESFSKLSDEHNLFLIQKEIRDTDQIALQGLNNIHQLGEHIETFEDTAAIIEHMDLIISIDTSLAHLAGALGKKVFILLPWCPDWRWLATGIHSPWYPTATLFRQSSIHGWGSVMDEVGAMTSTIVKASSSSP